MSRLAVYLTTDLPQSFTRAKRVRRRRRIAEGSSVRIRLAPIRGDEETATLFVDGEPVARLNFPYGCEWHQVNGNAWGNGLDIRSES